MIKSLWNDEAGVILSAEIVLIGTILVLGVIVGLVELQSAVVQELGDLGGAFGVINQSYNTSGFRVYKNNGTDNKAITYGFGYADVADECDKQDVAMVCTTVNEP